MKKYLLAFSGLFFLPFILIGFLSFLIFQAFGAGINLGKSFMEYLFD